MRSDDGKGTLPLGVAAQRKNLATTAWRSRNRM